MHVCVWTFWNAVMSGGRESCELVIVLLYFKACFGLLSFASSYLDGTKYIHKRSPFLSISSMFILFQVSLWSFSSLLTYFAMFLVH